MQVRVGQGFDVHPFAPVGDRPLVLGGVTFDGERGLAGHSDADVIAHAVTDALLGAAGLGDIGQHFPDTDPALAGVVVPGPGLRGHSDADVACHAVADALLGAAGLGDIGSHFPDTDPQWEGAASTDLLAAVHDLVTAAGLVVENVDLTLILEVPILAPHVPAMRQRLGDLLGAPVSIKAKRAEGLGAIGRREGIACIAVALLRGARPRRRTSAASRSKAAAPCASCWPPAPAGPATCG